MLRRVSRDLGQRCLVNHNSRHHTALPGNRWVTSPKLVQCSQGTDKTTSEFRRNQRVHRKPWANAPSSDLSYLRRALHCCGDEGWQQHLRTVSGSTKGLQLRARARGSSSIKSLDLCRRFKHSKIFKASLSFTAQLKHDFLRSKSRISDRPSIAAFFQDRLSHFGVGRIIERQRLRRVWRDDADGILGMETCQRTEI